MDPLSDVLSLLKPRSYIARGFDVGGEWSVRFEQHQGIKCYDRFPVSAGWRWRAFPTQQAFRLAIAFCCRMESLSA
jgi:hypothetical protein